MTGEEERLLADLLQKQEEGRNRPGLTWSVKDGRMRAKDFSG
jgi:hypothetical protein